MILVTGATGTVGSALIRELAGRAPVRALVRDDERASALAQHGVDVAIGRFEDAASLAAAMQGVTSVFLLSPPGDRDMVDAQLGVLSAAVAAPSVRRVVKLSSIAADERPKARILAAHRTIEEHIERSGLAWTHLRPHWFMQNELGQAASIAGERTFSAPDVTRISAIDARDVAAVAAVVLTTDGHDGKAYVLTGPEALGYGDVAAVYTQILGAAVRWSEVSLEEARASMLAAGLSPDLAAGFAEILERYQEGGVTSEVSPAVEAILGRAPRTFADFVADHRASFVPAPATAL